MRQNKFFMKKKNTTDTHFANIEEGLSKTEQFVEKNWKVWGSIIALLISLFVGYYLYQNLYKAPRNETAKNQLFIGEQYFEKDSFRLALDGKDNFDGFISISEKYSNTKSGQLATYYCGISYLRIGEYQNAIKMLDKFNSNDNLLMSIANTAIGDAFSELNQPNEAIEYYEKSIKIHSNKITTPITLMKCAILFELQEDYTRAIDCYNTIKEQYPESKLAENIDKYIEKINFK